MSANTELQMATHANSNQNGDDGAFQIKNLAQLASASDIPLEELQRLDANGDGNIDAQELVEFVEKYRQVQSSRRGYCIAFVVVVVAFVLSIFSIFGVSVWANHITKDTKLANSNTRDNQQLLTDINGNVIRTGGARVATSAQPVNGSLNANFSTNPSIWAVAFSNSSNSTRRRLSEAELFPVQIPLLSLKRPYSDQRMHFHIIGYDHPTIGWSTGMKRRRLQSLTSPNLTYAELASLISTYSVGHVTRELSFVFNELQLHVKDVAYHELASACTLFQEGRVSFGSAQATSTQDVFGGHVQVEFMSGCDSGHLSSGRFTLDGKTYSFTCPQAGGNCRLSRMWSTHELQDAVITSNRRGQFPPTAEDLQIFDLQATQAFGTAVRRRLGLLPGGYGGAAIKGAVGGCIAGGIGGASLGAAAGGVGAIPGAIIGCGVGATVGVVMGIFAEAVSNCYPSSATVWTPSGKRFISQIKVGDEVLVYTGSKLAWSPVYMRGHASGSIGEYLTFQTHNRRLSLSALHFVPIVPQNAVSHCGPLLNHVGQSETIVASSISTSEASAIWKQCVVMTRAQRAKLGDWVLVVNDGANTGSMVSSTLAMEKILSVDEESKFGLFNPYTKSGTIVVDGVIGSVHSELAFEHHIYIPQVLQQHLPGLYQMLFSPIVAIYDRYPQCMKALDDSYPFGLDGEDVGKISKTTISCFINKATLAVGWTS